MSSNDSRQDLAPLRPHQDDDTIDLGELLRGLFAQWQLIISVTILGAVLAVLVALLLPKQYRVEAIVSQPSRADVQPLLAQDLAPLTLDELTQAFLLNVQSLNVIEQAYNNTGMGDREGSTPLTPEQIFSDVRSVSDALSVGPVRYDFYELENDEKTPLNNLSISLLTAEPAKAKVFLDELLVLAEKKTLNDTISNITATKAIRIKTAHAKYEQLLKSAEASLDREQERVRQALSVARTLGIEEPTSWEALVHGAGNVQMVTGADDDKDDLFLNGTRFLEARLESLNSKSASQLFLDGIEEQHIDEKGNVTVVHTTPSQLQGEIRALSEQVFSAENIQLLNGSVEARIPGNAEKPNRPLIAIAGTVLAGFLGLFIALIRLAVIKRN